MNERDETNVETFFKTFSGKDSSGKDVEEFGQLVSTYIDGQKWVTRPLVLSPLVCSQYGWKCINSNLLQCVSCGAKLCTPESKIEFYDAYRACIGKILKDLKTNHKTHCPWPLAPSPESFIKMTPMPKEESLKLFKQRFVLSLAFSSSFPQIKEHIVSQLGLEEQHISSLCKLAEVSTEDAQKFGTSAVCLAATGWNFKSQGGTGAKVLVSCENCQRSIWTKSFKLLQSSNNDKDSSQTSEAAAAAMQNGKRPNTRDEGDSPSVQSKRFKKDDFDPISEHRPWCLWVITQDTKQHLESDTSKEKSETSVPGWQIFMKSLLRNVFLPQQCDTENNPSKEEIRSVRSLLETWIDPV